MACKRSSVRLRYTPHHQQGSHCNGPFLIKNHGVVAHLVEHLVRNQKVVGSSPIYSTRRDLLKVSSFFVGCYLYPVCAATECQVVLYLISVCHHLRWLVPLLLLWFCSCAYGSFVSLGYESMLSCWVEAPIPQGLVVSKPRGANNPFSKRMGLRSMRTSS